MTDITPLIPEGRKIITSYGDGRFMVSGEEHKGSIIILPENVLHWDVTAAEDISIASLEQVMAHKEAVEVLLLGTGPGLVFPSQALVRELRTHGIVVEVMDSGAACRTYNVLLSEERPVAAAIIAV